MGRATRSPGPSEHAQFKGWVTICVHVASQQLIGLHVSQFDGDGPAAVRFSLEFAQKIAAKRQTLVHSSQDLYGPN